MVSTAEALAMLGTRTPKGAKSEAAARDLVRAGLPAAVIERLARAYGVPIEKIQTLIGLSKATGSRRRQTASAPLRAVNSDRALRLGRVYAMARHVFENDENARIWFKEKNRELKGERPLDLLDTDVGTQEVLRSLNRLEHGIYS